MSLDSDWTQRVMDLLQESSADPVKPPSIPWMKSTTSFDIMTTKLHYLKSEIYTEDEVRRIVDLRLLRREALKLFDWKSVQRYSKELYDTTKHYGYTPWLRS